MRTFDASVKRTFLKTFWEIIKIAGTTMNVTLWKTNLVFREKNDLSSANVFNLDEAKILSGLKKKKTFSQTMAQKVTDTDKKVNRS